jgi:preprotein translocase subunit SecF
MGRKQMKFMNLIKKYKYVIISFITVFILLLLIYNYTTRQLVAFGVDNTGEPVIYIPSCNEDIQLSEIAIKSYRSNGFNIE